MKIQEIHKGDGNYPKSLLSLKNQAPNTIYALGNVELLYAHHRVTIFGDKVDEDILDKVVRDYANKGYTAVCNLSSQSDNTIVETALQHNMQIIAVVNGDFARTEGSQRCYIDRVLDNNGLVITVCRKGARPGIHNDIHFSFPVLAALPDELYITEITKEMSTKVVRYAWWLHRPISTHVSAAKDKTRIHLLINSRYYLQKRIKEIMAKTNNTDKRILVISNRRKDIQTRLTQEVLRDFEGYELLDLYIDAYKDSETYVDDIAKDIIGIDPAIIMVNPNIAEIQRLLLQLWHYQKIADKSYFYSQQFDSTSTSLAKLFIEGHKYEHHSGTNIRDVLDKAAQQIDVAEYAPVLDTSEQTDESENAPQTKKMSLMDRICRNGYPLDLVDEE